MDDELSGHRDEVMVAMNDEAVDNQYADAEGVKGPAPDVWDDPDARVEAPYDDADVKGPDPAQWATDAE